jgi:hypothetical protein
MLVWLCERGIEVDRASGGLEHLLDEVAHLAVAQDRGGQLGSASPCHEHGAGLVDPYFLDVGLVDVGAARVPRPAMASYAVRAAVRESDSGGSVEVSARSSSSSTTSSISRRIASRPALGRGRDAARARGPRLDAVHGADYRDTPQSGRCGRGPYAAPGWCAGRRRTPIHSRARSRGPSSLPTAPLATGRRSTTSTLQPARASSVAATRALQPVPITTASTATRGG